ncbi:MAG: MFS transporter [Chloroflexi bacterium]|nr:MFS transporter [Chloroflexota bacterium]
MSSAMNVGRGKISTPARPTTEAQLREGQAIIDALDNSPLTRRHQIFLVALVAALTFDYAKPFNIAFVIPGMKAMWGLSAVESSYLAVAGLSGIVIGSVVWGFVADRIGRRPTLLWTVAVFSIACLCGLAVAYWNSLLACFIMGFGVGGEAPIVYALAAEYLPAKGRARSLLFLGMLGSLLGYLQVALVSAVLKSFLPETDAWRWMWLLNIPLGLIVFVMRNNVVPESARYLIKKGRIDEARASAERFVGVITTPPQSSPSVQSHIAASQPASTIAPTSLRARTIAIGVFAFGAGLANFSFVTWLPTMLINLGYSGASSSLFLAVSALSALPALVLTSIVLRKWGTRGTLVGYALAAGAALFALGYGATFGLFTPLLMIPLMGVIFFLVTSINGTLSFYGAEIFPTSVRVRRSGIISAVNRLGGVVGPFFGGLYLTAGGNWFGLNLPLTIGLVIGAVVLYIVGVETHSRSLEQISGH